MTKPKSNDVIAPVEAVPVEPVVSAAPAGFVEVVSSSPPAVSPAVTRAYDAWAESSLKLRQIEATFSTHEADGGVLWSRLWDARQEEAARFETLKNARLASGKV